MISYPAGTVMVFPLAQLDGQCFSAFSQQASCWAQGSKWRIYYCNVHSYVLEMSWDTHELCIAARSRDWGRQQWKSRKGHWDKSSLNDLEPQVWKSQALNEADGWRLRKKEASPPAWLPASCVLFSLLWLKSGGDLRVEATSHICTSTGACCVYVAKYA